MEDLTRYTVVHSRDVAVLFVDTRPVDAVAFHHNLRGTNDPKSFSCFLVRRPLLPRAIPGPRGPLKFGDPQPEEDDGQNQGVHSQAGDDDREGRVQYAENAEGRCQSHCYPQVVVAPRLRKRASPAAANLIVPAHHASSASGATRHFPGISRIAVSKRHRSEGGQGQPGLSCQLSGEAGKQDATRPVCGIRSAHRDDT